MSLEARVAKAGVGGLERARHAESADPHAAAVPDLSHAIPAATSVRRSSGLPGPCA
ncbi:hypothetical protein SY2F82_77870 [Streptomyces sp. Y2F8-2]|nr:hypothetical protein SY2F82_77870 [Streptomyces sp. Y2F8-2]